MSDFEKIDIYRDQSLIKDPYPYFDHLRQQSPVQPEPQHGTFLMTGYEEALAVYHDVETWSSANSVTGPFPGFDPPLEGDDVTEQIEQQRDKLPFSDQLPTFDPPKHTQHRGLLMRLLTPKRLRENEEFMGRLADRQIDEFIDRGKVEFMREYASPFALLVVADLLGVPESDQPRFREQLQGPEALTNAGLGSPEEGETLAHKPLEFLYDAFTNYIEERRREPRNDVLTLMAQATYPDGSTPDVPDVVRIAANLFAAGQETTAKLMGAMFLILAERPDLQKLLREERPRIPNFVEETLRMESPVKGDFRVARRKTTVGGVDIHAGTTVFVLNGAANRDPRMFENPSEFDVDRANARQHLTFARGPHVCPGAPLARAEARISVERWLDRFTDIRIDEDKHGPPNARDYRYAPTYILRGLNRLFLEFTPAG
jgi:cytochrome P450